MTWSKGQKIVAVALGMFSIASLSGTYLYIPSRVNKLEQKQDLDHDTLIEVKNDVKNINRRLELNGIVSTNKTNEDKYQAVGQLPMLWNRIY